MVTYTPIPYFLSLPWAEACTWAAEILGPKGGDA
jgi:hypothetical protein